MPEAAFFCAVLVFSLCVLDYAFFIVPFLCPDTMKKKQQSEGMEHEHSKHQFGIPNIKKAVEKYDGQCSFRPKDGTYLLKILIPIP